MDRRTCLLAPLLAAAVTWGGVACACALPSPALGSPAATHVAHHDHDAPASADCERADCQADCTLDGLPPDRGPQVAEAPSGPSDDAVEAALHGVRAATPLPPPRNHSPPIPHVARAADTPVRRFDRLLN